MAQSIKGLLSKSEDQNSDPSIYLNSQGCYSGSLAELLRNPVSQNNVRSNGKYLTLTPEHTCIVSMHPQTHVYTHTFTNNTHKEMFNHIPYTWITLGLFHRELKDPYQLRNIIYEHKMFTVG